MSIIDRKPTTVKSTRKLRAICKYKEATSTTMAKINSYVVGVIDSKIEVPTPSTRGVRQSHCPHNSGTEIWSS